MTPFSDPPGTSSLLDSYDGYIEQVRHLLRANHVPFGTPFDFLILAQTLEHNAQLRSDLAVLLQSFMEGEKKISHRTALGIIAVASGGPGFTTSSNGVSLPAGGGSQPVNVLVDLLMSVGGRIQTSAQNLDGHFDSHLDIRPDSSSSEPIDGETPEAPLLPPSSSDQETTFEQFVGAHWDHRSPLEALPARSNQNSNQDSNQDSPPQASLPHSGAEDPLAETLSRLELNSLQVKHYLDSIDQRISRIEPRLDNLPTYVPSPATSHPVSGLGSGYGHVPDRRYSALVATATLPHQAHESQEPRDEPPPLDPAPTRSIPSDLPSLLESSFRQKHSRKKFEVPIIIGAALVLLLLFYWGFNQNTQSSSIGSANPSLAQNTPIPPSDPAPANDGNASGPSEGATARPSPSHTARAEVLPGVHRRPLYSSTPAGLNVSSPSSAPTTPAASATPEESDDSTLTSEPITVSAGVMAANVLSAPQPSYPLLASLTRMRGEVVMKAIISKDGTIQNVHVIKGHRLLRGAATNAVRTWRYRPYLVNGRPVEVATTVSVDFNQAQ
jgi:TonB family protein